MAALDAFTEHSFRRDFSLAQAAVKAGVTVQRSAAADSQWLIWAKFCTDLAIDPYLSEFKDKIALLQVFAHRYRVGILAPSGHTVKARTVEDALRSVGQAFARMGLPDPRLTAGGKLDFRLHRMLSAYHKQDPPPHRVKPIPVQVLRRIMAVASAGTDPGQQAIADMIALAYFYLLRPGEYTGTQSESTPFRVQDISLFYGNRRLNLATCTDAEISSATFGVLEFTTQKNGVRGECIGLGLSGDAWLCPVKALGRRVLHNRRHQSPPTAPIAQYFHNNKWNKVSSAHITTALRLAVTYLGPVLGFLASDVSARSLRAAGAMSLLCAQVDTDVIRLIGRWRSDEMLRYLHVQAAPVMRDFAAKMLAGGSFVLHPSQAVPSY
jgi:hypothetical protein